MAEKIRQTMDKPNILWVCSDSQRYDALGCYGNSWLSTPHADRLAAQGTRFEHAYAQNPLCQPSRGSFLSGRYPSTNRLRQNGQNCPTDLRPVTKAFDEAGYVCGLSGKLHLSACDNRLKLGPEWWKYDSQHYWQGREPRIDDGYSEFYWDHSGSPAHRSSDFTRWLHERGKSGKTTPREDCQFVNRGLPSEDHQATWCTNKAIGFMQSYADAPNPWLFSVNLFDPHAAFDPPEDYLEPYLDKLDDIPLPNFDPDELTDKPAVQQQRHEKAYADHTERDHRMKRAAYWAMCDHLDVQLGRLLETLERTGQADNTIVIFMSDHGEMLGDHGLYIKGPFLYDEAIRVPLIVRYPEQVQAGMRSSAMVELTDLAPTLVEAAGLEMKEALPGVQGRSLWPLLTGQASPEQFRDEVYCEYLNANPDKPAHYLSMVRDRRYKLIAWHGEPVGELYDLETDPHERHNLWHDPSAAATKCRLLERLAARQAFTADPLPPRVGVY